MGTAPQRLQPLQYSAPPDEAHPIICPKCKSTDVRRSMRRNLIDAVLEFFELAPYRCRHCRLLFHRPY
jgi:hypothetical protein